MGIKALSKLQPGDPVWLEGEPSSVAEVRDLGGGLREPVRVTLLETVLEVEPEAGIVTVVDGAGPATERRPPAESPRRYVEACRLLQDGAMLEYRGRAER
jgi:hypothetical protein